LLAWQATSSLSPGEQLVATLAGGLIAFIAHGGKTAIRSVVTPSPEPFSNISLSMGEDVFAVGLTWLATVHPFIAAAIAAIFVLLSVLFIRWIWTALSTLFRSAQESL
jgi:VIT1/CCC1 family predicted Fe2+/Mn2+ transporter